jgi:hypothetical protein
MDKFSKLQGQYRSRLDFKRKNLDPWVHHATLQRIEGSKAENSSAFVRETGTKRKEEADYPTSDLDVNLHFQISFIFRLLLNYL